jgi:hypothetical protein
MACSSVASQSALWVETLLSPFTSVAALLYMHCAIVYLYWGVPPVRLDQWTDIYAFGGYLLTRAALSALGHAGTGLSYHDFLRSQQAWFFYAPSTVVSPQGACVEGEGRWTGVISYARVARWRCGTASLGPARCGTQVRYTGISGFVCGVCTLAAPAVLITGRSCCDGWTAKRWLGVPIIAIFLVLLLGLCKAGYTAISTEVPWNIAAAIFFGVSSACSQEAAAG